MSVLYPITQKINFRNSKKKNYSFLLKCLFLFFISVFSFAISYSQESEKEIYKRNEAAKMEATKMQAEKREAKMRLNPKLQTGLQVNDQLKEQNAVIPVEKLNLLPIEKDFTEASGKLAKQLLVDKEGVSVPGVEYTVFTNSSGQVEYRITNAGQSIFSKQIISSGSNYDKKVKAEKEAIYASNTFRRNLQYPKDALLAELNSFANQPNSIISSNRNNIVQSTLADYTFNGGAGTINVSGPATPYPSTITVSGVPAGVTVKSVTINGLNHTWSDDVDIVLQSPAGTNVILMSDAGGSADLINHNYSFEDGAALSLSATAVLASGTYKPTNFVTGDNWPAPGPGTAPSSVTLSTFGTASHNGTWSLFVFDDVGGDQGSWGSWSITFTDPVAGCSPITITSQPANASVCPFPSPSSLVTFSVGATPAGVNYNWQVDNGSGFTYLTNGGVYSGVNNSTLTITGATAAMNGYKYRCILICPTSGLPEISNFGTLTVLSAPPAAPIISPSSISVCPNTIVPIRIIVPQTEVTFTGGLITISTGAAAPAAPYPSVINVSGLPAGSTIKSVQINGISHTWSDDLDILLQSPTGTNVVLMSDVGGSTNLSLSPRNYSFNDAAATGLTIGTPGSISGTYRPTNNGASDTYPAPIGAITQGTPTIASFGAASTNGAWNLYVSDDAGGDGGSINNWSITFTLPPTPTYSSSGIITISTGAAGPASPYPSGINVSGLPVGASVKSVQINGISHTWSDDLDLLLKSPAGTNVVLMSDVGGSTNLSLSPRNYSFDDAAATGLTIGSPGSISGTYRPTNNGATDTYPAPIGAITQATPTIATFGNGDHNGTWNLYVADDAGGDGGTINDWSITFSIPPAGPGVGIFSPNTNLYTDAPATIPYTGTSVSTVYAKIPAAGVYNYTVSVSNGTCNSPTSVSTITVLAPPSVTAHPVSTNGCVGGVRTFTVAATGAAITYQWQVDQGAGFVNLANAAPYSGVTTATLTITNLTLTLNGYLYRCVVSGTCTPAVTSNNATLTVNSLPVITVGPNYQCSPVVLTASGANTYTWSPTTGLSPTTGATVTANPTVNTTYTVTGTNTATGCTNTAQAIVNGTPSQPAVSPAAPVICLGTVQPMSTFSSATLTSSSGPVTVNVPDASTTGATHTLAIAGIPGGGVVTGVSVNLNLTHTWDGDMVINLRAPNGNVLNLVNSLNGGTGSVSGDNFTNTTISSTGVTALSSGTPPYSGLFAADGAIGAGPIGNVSNTGTFAGLYSVGNGNWTLAMQDLFGGDFGILTSWSITLTYGVGNPAQWTPVTGLFTDVAGTIPYVAGTQVTNIYASPATTTTYTVTSSNTGPGGAGGDVVVNSTQVPITISSASATYGNPNPSTITASLLNPGTTVKSVTIGGISHTWLSDVNIVLVSPTGTPVILMSETGDDDDISGSPRTYTFSDAAAGSLSVANPASPSGTYKPTNFFTPDNFPAPGPGSLTQAAPTLSSFTGNLNGVWNLYIRDYFSGDGGQVANWSITFNTPGGTVTCTSPPRSVTVTVNNPIVFTTQPVNRTACQNSTVTYTVAATGTITTIQWQVSVGGGPFTNIAGATTSTLTLTNVQPSMTGNQYRSVLSNVGCGSFNSASASLTVNALPTVSLSITPAGQTQLKPGMQTTVTVSSSPAGATYQWFVNGLLQGGISGSSYVVDAYHLGTYTVRVTDVNGCVNTTAGITFTAIPSTNLFIYPNPTSGAYYVTYYVPQVGSAVTISVFDMKGRRITERHDISSAPYTRFNFSSGALAAGVYVIEIRDSGGDRLGYGRLVVTR